MPKDLAFEALDWLSHLAHYHQRWLRGERA
jgi:hypothetical protein